VVRDGAVGLLGVLAARELTDEQAADGYRAMDTRQAIKVLLRP
jgi:hypothetical protein